MTARGHVLVTGASGFIGRDVSVRLAEAGWRVRAAARDVTAVPPHPAIEPARLPDLSRAVEWGGLVDDVTHVLHLAALAHSVTTIPAATYHAVNAEAVRSLGDAARKADVRRVVLVSSVRAQTGPTAAGVVTEVRPPQPEDDYGRSKLNGERSLAEALSGSETRWCVLRPVVLYGPGVKGNVATLRRLAMSRWPLPVGALAARRSMLGLQNAASAFEHALTATAVDNGTFLLADPGPLTIAQIVKAMRGALGRRALVPAVPLWPVKAAATLLGKSESWRRIAGDLVVSTAALEATGWTPRYTTAEGLADWMRREPP